MKNRRSLLFFAIALVSLALTIKVYPLISPPQGSNTHIFNPHRVAHAGGGIDQHTYTNSYEALDTNLNNGFIYFEIDFSYTADNKLVCLHDWTQNFRENIGFSAGKRLSLNEFERLTREKGHYTNCTLDGLAEWMRKNSSTHIITDVKDDNTRALRDIYQKLPDARRRVIPQIYQPGDFTTIKAIGYEKIIWTLYRFNGDNDEVIRWIDSFQGPIAVTMSKARAASTLPYKLNHRKIPSYVHTVNSTFELVLFTSIFGVSDIYTDFLLP